MKLVSYYSTKDSWGFVGFLKSGQIFWKLAGSVIHNLKRIFSSLDLWSTIQTESWFVIHYTNQIRIHYPRLNMNPWIRETNPRVYDSRSLISNTYLKQNTNARDALQLIWKKNMITWYKYLTIWRINEFDFCQDIERLLLPLHDARKVVGLASQFVFAIEALHAHPVPLLKNKKSCLFLSQNILAKKPSIK
jgi:hypothetical protein